MCGINGFVQFEGIYKSEMLKAIVHKMNQQIIHRGPDSEGLFSDAACALGMRRLSIIDLQNGDQPIWNETRDKLIVFNGELYNYLKLKQDLKQKGHFFSTDADTDVVLHGFESYGLEFLKQMEGMFSFAIYDLSAKTWTIARDKIGEKPLYYYQDEEKFLFASELKSLLCTGLVPKIIDRESLSQYFQLTYIPAPKSILRNVRKLMPATYMVIHDDGSTFTEKYWNLHPLADDELLHDKAACKSALREALFHSVEQRMISDVPLGAFLSGGIDSSIIVGIMSRLSPKPINTFTIGFKDKSYDESSLAKIVSQKNHTNHHVLTLDWNEVASNIDTILDNIDEPFADSSLIATYAVSKMTREYVTVALTGDAGDELFAGYNKYLIAYYGEKYNRVPKIIREGIIRPAIGLLPANNFLRHKASKVIAAAGMDIFQMRKRMMCLGFKEEELRELMLDGYADPMSFIRQEYDFLEGMAEQTRTQYVDLKTVLEGDMLTKVDRASMLASLETRVPMLDTKVIELAYRIPASYKINSKNKKIVLKETFQDLLPEEVLSARKHGFGLPIGTWLETVLKDRLLSYSDKDYLERQGIFNSVYIQNMIRMHLEHKEDRYSELWAFFVFQNWYERTIE